MLLKFSDFDLSNGVNSTDFVPTDRKPKSKISEPDMNTLKNCAWPGNVRELRNIVERSMILSSGDTLTLKKSMSATVLEEDDTYPAGVSLADVEKQHIIKTLTQTGWRVSGKKGAATLLGLKPTTLEARMKKLGISRPA
jgi:formate hydrogenlyase transcriptional activator